MKPNKNSNILNLALDFYKMHMKSLLLFLFVILTFTIIGPILLSDTVKWELSFVESVYNASKIYLAIAAVFICIATMGFMVKNGVTRKDYFYGTAFAATGMSFTIMILATVVSWILELIGIDFFTSSVTFLDTSSTWLIPILSLSLILFSYYIAGWIIATGFYRYGSWETIGFIAIAIWFVLFIDIILWGEGIEFYIASSFIFSTRQFSIFILLGVTAVLNGLALWLVRSITRRIPIKIE